MDEVEQRMTYEVAATEHEYLYPLQAGDRGRRVQRLAGAASGSASTPADDGWLECPTKTGVADVLG
ncbi:hypothetical protein CFAM422_006395 [Trichoderma lentiforme]|uniref:Uncharacterized protein n=1 Tax=Trichoderma lentiforme TaxID=1567552 RepID=A0A9P5CDF9_9HYPO|nr:hypothetical protein CFAM422_006395 [Trichoderma lentiforme]